MLFAIPVVGVFFAFIVPGCDAVSHGPYASWYNRRCQRLSDNARLVGGPESKIVEVLGPPSSYYGRADATRRTYNYAPFRLIPAAKFQVHCENGIVVAIEQFDD